MRVGNKTGKYTDNFGSVVTRMYMKLGSEFRGSLRFKNQHLKRLQCVIVGAGATHSQNNGAVGNGGSLKDGAEAFALFLRGAQLVLRPSVLTVLDIIEVDASMLSFLGRCCLGKVDRPMAGSAPSLAPSVSPCHS